MSCGVYVIQRPATGGSQTLSYAYNPLNTITISGGNSIDIKGKQELSIAGNTLSISDGAGTEVNNISIPIVPFVTLDYGYWRVFFDFNTGCFTATLKDLFLTNRFGTAYYLVPFITTPFINKTFFSYYNNDKVDLKETNYDYTKPSAIALTGTIPSGGGGGGGGTPAINSVNSVQVTGKVSNLNNEQIVKYNTAVNTIITTAGKYVIDTFTTTTATGSSNSLFYLQYAFDNSMVSSSSNFNILITQVSSGADIYTSPSIAFSGASSTDTEQLINNQVLVIPAGILLPNTNYQIRFFLTATVSSGNLIVTELFYNFSMV